MSSTHLHKLLIVVALAVVGCAGSGHRPELAMLGVEKPHRLADPNEVVVFVKVSNPARRPMRLQRLQYSFAGAGRASGEISLRSFVGAGASVVVEVPVDLGDLSVVPGKMLTMTGKLTAEQDAMVRTYRVNAEVDPFATAAP